MPIDVGQIAAVAGSLKTAADIARGLLELRVGMEVQAKVIELNGVILAAQSGALAAQSDQFALLEKVRELEKEIADMKAWGSERERYELKEIRPGSLAYSLKPEAQEGEPPHWICAACYERGKKRILQRGVAPASRDFPWSCPECKATIYTSYMASPGRTQD